MPLRILTANVYNGRAEPSSLAAVIDRFSPDVIAVQELNTGVAQLLSGWGVARLLDPRDDTTGMGMALTVPAELERLDFPNRIPIRARFDGASWGLPPVEVVNTHLVNPIARPILESKRLRRAECAALVDIMEQPAPTRIVVGDFNSSPVWPLYRRISRLAVDGAVAAGTARRTWGYFPNTPATLRIDHVFVQGATCTSTEVAKVTGADHRALVVDIEP